MIHAPGSRFNRNSTCIRTVFVLYCFCIVFVWCLYRAVAPCDILHAFWKDAKPRKVLNPGFSRASVEALARSGFRSRQYSDSTATVQRQYIDSTDSTATVQRQYIDSTATVHRQYSDSTSTAHRQYTDSNWLSWLGWASCAGWAGLGWHSAKPRKSAKHRKVLNPCHATCSMLQV